jgi:hypothetical protein
MAAVMSATFGQWSRFEEQSALLGVLRHLKAVRYRFVTPTPATHERILARRPRGPSQGLRDALGWNLPFERGVLDPTLIHLLDAAGAIFERDGLCYSSLRVSSLDNDLFLHSAFPTLAKDAVFFGPDSYRFANLIKAELQREPARLGAHIVDLGTGTGVGAIVAAHASRGPRITITDINPKALNLARINAMEAGVEVEPVLGANLAAVSDPVDLALANPPYIVDEAGRAYRDGGAMHGCAVALQMARLAVARLAPGGRMILYTGSPIIQGEDRFQGALCELLVAAGCTLRYGEIDPDVFGEELASPAYRDVERIALVFAIIQREIC